MMGQDISLWVKKRHWYGAYYDERGKRRLVATGVAVNLPRAKEKARRILDGLKADVARVKAGGVPIATAGPMTVREYAKRWHADRDKAGVRDVRNERTRLRLHALEVRVEGRVFGDIPLADVRRSHVKALALELRSGNLSPRSKHHVLMTVTMMFAEAARDEMIEASPCRDLEAERLLGPKEDADPEWRRAARFSPEEVAALISDLRLPAERRVCYAILFLTGVRFGELAGLRWRHLTAAEPLSELLVAHSYDKGTKTGVVRRVPVHPRLAAVLAAWKLGGWYEHMGRTPKPDDLIVPSRRGTMRKQPASWLGLQADLAKLGVRGRRQHDSRRTFITLARACGCAVDLLRVMTHGLRRGQIMDLYTDEEGLWRGLCAEVAKIEVPAGEELAAVQGGKR